jgi:hypothetical protein
MTALSYLVYASAGITIVGATPSAVRAAHWLWRRTQAGRRAALQTTLDQLACGSTREYVNDLLGPPKFVGSIDGRPQQIHRIDGAWIAVEFIDNVVLAFSITITDPGLAYPIDAQTQLTMWGSLGRDNFAQVRGHEGNPIPPGDQLLWIGAYRWMYTEAYYLGRPGAYQHYWLSHSMAGCGSFNPGPISSFASGGYQANRLADHAREQPPNRAAMTANTLTVMNPDVRADPGASVAEPAAAPTSPSFSEQFFARGVLGTDRETLRLDVTRLRDKKRRALRRRRGA